MELFLIWVFFGIMLTLTHAQCYLVYKLFDKIKLKDKSSNVILICFGLVFWIILGEMMLLMSFFPEF